MDQTNSGFSTEFVFDLAVDYCSTHAAFISYRDRCTLVSLHKMAVTSSNPSKSTSLLFEVQEEDWVREWDKFGDVPPSEAMKIFVATLNSNSGQFSKWIDEFVNKTTLEQQTTQSTKTPEVLFSTYVKRPSHIQIVEPTSDSLSPISQSIGDVTKILESAGRGESPDEPNGSEVCTSPVSAGYLWCQRSQAAEFIGRVKEEPDARVVIAPGESITVKVPVHPSLSTLFWEYVTERHDIGFGVELEVIKDDSDSSSLDSPSRLTQIIPMERRHSCEDVIVGCHRASSLSELHSHRIYYLRFDNKYSLFTRKVLYYKVYCRAPDTTTLQ